MLVLSWRSFQEGNHSPKPEGLNLALDAKSQDSRLPVVFKFIPFSQQLGNVPRSCQFYYKG